MAAGERAQLKQLQPARKGQAAATKADPPTEIELEATALARAVGKTALRRLPCGVKDLIA